MTTDRTAIGAQEFSRRLVTLCLQSRGGGLPRRRRDRHIVLKSVVLTLDAAATYREPQINARLEAWLAGVGSGFAVDHVGLRRELVDAGFLTRDAAGAGYRVASPDHPEVCFEPDVERLDPAALIGEARARRERRRRQYTSASGED